LLEFPHPHQQMEMIFQQAVRVRFRDGFDVLGVELHKVRVIALFDKYVFAVRAAIVNVVEHARLNCGWTGQVFLPDPKGLQDL
jgi:hypothetical protein